MSTKVREKGKLDRSATITVGNIFYNVHPKVKEAFEGLYAEYMQTARAFHAMHPFEEKERALLNKIVTICEPMPDIPKELVGFIQDIKDLMKSVKVENKSEDNGSKE